MSGKSFFRKNIIPIPGESINLKQASWSYPPSQKDSFWFFYLEGISEKVEWASFPLRWNIPRKMKYVRRYIIFHHQFYIGISTSLYLHSWIICLEDKYRSIKYFRLKWFMSCMIPNCRWNSLEWVKMKSAFKLMNRILFCCKAVLFFSLFFLLDKIFKFRFENIRRLFIVRSPDLHTRILSWEPV